MPCYALNPVLLVTSNCERKVCIHCRSDIRLSASQRENGAWYEDMVRNASQGTVPPRSG